MTQATYIIGAPGTGKSTLMDRFLEGWDVGPYVRFTERELFGHYLTKFNSASIGAYLGHRRPGYPGTDALSLAVAPQALLWLERLPSLGLDHVYGEGFRLSHLSFLTALAAITDLTVVYLKVDPEEAARRRAARGGKQLSPQFCKTAATKADNVARACRDAGIRVVTARGVARLPGRG